MLDRAGRSIAAVTEVARAAISSARDDDVVGPVLAAVRDVIGADAAGYYTHEIGGWATAVHIDPVEIWRVLPFVRAPTSAAARLHPGIRRVVQDRSGVPFAVTDLISARSWWTSELGVLMRPDWGRNYQLALPVARAASDAVNTTWVMGRTTRDFTASDRDVARAISPVLAAVTQHRIATARLRVDLDTRMLLTPRERAVLALIADGLSAPAIGRVLGMSPRTAQKHTQHIYRKLDVHGRAQALSVGRTGGGVGRGPDDRRGAGPDTGEEPSA